MPPLTLFSKTHIKAPWCTEPRATACSPPGFNPQVTPDRLVYRQVYRGGVRLCFTAYCIALKCCSNIPQRHQSQRYNAVLSCTVNPRHPQFDGVLRAQRRSMAVAGQGEQHDVPARLELGRETRTR